MDMQCPNCGRSDALMPRAEMPYVMRRPRRLGNTVYRAHMCRHCGVPFFSEQRPLSHSQVAKLADSLEILQLSSSSKQQQQKDSALPSTNDEPAL